MKCSLHLESEYRYTDNPGGALGAVVAWNVETRFRYLVDLDEWHCRHILAQAVASDDQRARHEDFDLDPSIDELSESLRYESEAFGVMFRFEVAQDLAQVRFDRGQTGNDLIEMVHDALHGLALGQVEVRELVARIMLTLAGEIEVCVELRP
jgi:hypothetical protein